MIARVASGAAKLTSSSCRMAKAPAPGMPKIRSSGCTSRATSARKNSPGLDDLHDRHHDDQHRQQHIQSQVEPRFSGLQHDPDDIFHARHLSV